MEPEDLIPTNVTKIRGVNIQTFSNYEITTSAKNTSTYTIQECLPSWLFEPANTIEEDRRRKKIIDGYRKHRLTCAKNKQKRKKKK